MNHTFLVIVSLVFLAGCHSIHISEVTAVPLTSEAVDLGQVVVLSDLGGGVKPEVSRARKDAAVYETTRDVLAAVPGTIVVTPDDLLAALPAESSWREVSTKQLVRAARAVGVDTLCLVHVGNLTGVLLVGFVPFPGWRSDMCVEFELEILDVATAQTVTRTRRKRTTDAYFIVGSEARLIDDFATEVEHALRGSASNTRGAPENRSKEGGSNGVAF